MSASSKTPPGELPASPPEGRGAKFSGAHESPLFARVFDLARETLKLSESFPRSRRAVLGRRMEEAAFDLHAALANAAKAGAAARPLLAQADAALTRYRFCLRLACDLELLSEGRLEEIARLVAEVGRLLGGWQRKLTA